MSSEHILVVDDDRDIREPARMSLELIGGHTVLTADSGHAALHSIKTRPPAAVLLDVMRPGMDGLTVVARLRQDPATLTLPVVLLTAKDLPNRDSVGTTPDHRGAHQTIRPPHPAPTANKPNSGGRPADGNLPILSCSPSSNLDNPSHPPGLLQRPG